MAEQWFIDETKQRGLMFAVIAVDSSDVGRCRTQLLKLKRPGQSSLHFTTDSEETKARAYREIAAMPITATLVLVPSDVKPVPARERAVRYVARRAIEVEPQRIVFERDSAAEVNDRRWLRSELARYPEIEYQHVGKTGDPMLWVADGVAWAVQRGGKWLAMVQHLIVERVEV